MNKNKRKIRKTSECVFDRPFIFYKLGWRTHLVLHTGLNLLLSSCLMRKSCNQLVDVHETIHTPFSSFLERLMEGSSVGQRNVKRKIRASRNERVFEERDQLVGF